MAKTGVKIQAVDFDKGFTCMRCGIFGNKKVCDNCKPLKECSVCGLVLKGARYNFYQYDYVQTPMRLAERYYKEIRKSRMNPYTHDGHVCDDCKDYKSRIKNKCWVCEGVIENSASRFRNHGNMCKDCTGENLDEEIRNAVRIIGDGVSFQITE